MFIRKAEMKDLKELLEIYNYEVLNGISTLDLHPKSLEEWKKWFEAHNIDNHPLLVAEADHRIAGYASLSTYREKEAFQSTVELSVYVEASFRNRGVATKLMQSVIDLARQDENTHMIVSVITAGNQASEKLHEKFGFTYCGSLHEVGYKMGKYRSVDHYELKV